MAVKQRNDIGELFLAIIYEENILKSIEYYSKSVKNGYYKSLEKFNYFAKQNNSVAQFELGNLYENGFGIEINFDKSLKYYKLSQKNGNIHTEKHFNRLKNSNFYFSSKFEEFEDFILNYTIFFYSSNKNKSFFL